MPAAPAVVSPTWWDGLGMSRETVTVLTTHAASCGVGLDAYIAALLHEIATHADGNALLTADAHGDGAVILPFTRQRDPTPAA